VLVFWCFLYLDTEVPTFALMSVPFLLGERRPERPTILTAGRADFYHFNAYMRMGALQCASYVAPGCSFFNAVKAAFGTTMSRGHGLSEFRGLLYDKSEHPNELGKWINTK
jgi:hypothetical protein